MNGQYYFPTEIVRKPSIALAQFRMLQPNRLGFINLDLSDKIHYQPSLPFKLMDRLHPIVC